MPTNTSHREPGPEGQQTSSSEAEYDHKEVGTTEVEQEEDWIRRKWAKGRRVHDEERTDAPPGTRTVAPGVPTPYPLLSF